MKRQSIVFILLLLQVLFICIGCGSSDNSAESESAAATVGDAAAAGEAAEPAQAPVTEESFAVAEAAEEEIIADQKAANAENVEDVTGIFEGLEDNHTAIFSFNGAETAFYFEDPAVQNVLFEAVIDSPYTLSYSYDDSLGYVIYKISE